MLQARSRSFDYHVCISPSSAWDQRLVYTIRLQDRLPRIAVPLLPGDQPVGLDLQAVLDRAYDDGPYARRVPYVLERIVPPLTSKQAEWAARILEGTK
jgi:hypothetical protein